jgi:hypothetical protein
MATKISETVNSKNLFASEDDFSYGTTVASCAKEIRLGFIRKVYGIVAAQLLLTVAMGTWFMSSPAMTEFVQTSPYLLNASMICGFVALIALIAKKNDYPANMLLLAFFTLVEAYMVGTVVTYYQSASVLQAAMVCALITTGLTLFTFQTKYDFTFLHASFVSALWWMIGMSFISYFFPFLAFNNMVYCGIGALLFSGFIVVDTQMMMNKLGTDEYILCAINLYLDILNLFLYILRIMGERR